LIITCILFLFSGCEKKIDVTGVTIFPEICVIKVGETQQLTAIVTPDDADDKSVKWTSQTVWMIQPALADAVISVSEGGKVKGLSEGCALMTCITTNMFCEAKAMVYVGYAAAVDGLYSGSLFKNDEEIKHSEKIGIVRTSEYEAQFGLFFLPNAPNNALCTVTVVYESEKMKFSGTTTIDLEGVTTSVKVSGAVELGGWGNFEILVGDDVYSFIGKK
jgi:uncharacterized protein YjdB